MPVDPPDAAAGAALIAWYRAHARTLPWRRRPDDHGPPDPYAVWLSEVMLQQTTVATVRARHAAFRERWPTVGALAGADAGDVMAAWAGLGYYARARNLHACARQVAASGWPTDATALRALPGVGDYTAAAIAAIAFGKRVPVIDGNVERVIARLLTLDRPPSRDRASVRAAIEAMLGDAHAGDFAQALMDLAQSLCRPRAPACLACPIRRVCRAAASGAPEQWPVRAPKPDRPHRNGVAWWITDGAGHVVLATRADRRLLGGMRGLPTGGWDGGAEPGGFFVPGAPLGTVGHAFTHFTLDLTVMAGHAMTDCVLPPGHEWWPLAALGDAGLPTLFARAAALGRNAI